MPKLPTINSQSELSANVRTVSPVVNPNVSMANATYQKAANISRQGQLIAAMGKAFSDGIDTMQHTQSKAIYEKGAADILSRAEQDPDITNVDKYNQELSDLVKTSTKGIGNPFLKNNVIAQYNFDADLNKIKLGDIYRKKNIAYTKDVAIPEAVEGLTAKKIGAQSPAEFVQADADLKAMLDDNLNKGLITEKDRRAAIETSVKMLVENDVYVRPETVKAEIEKGKNGRYADLPLADRVKYIKEAETQIKQLKVDISQAEMEGQTSVFKNWNNMTPSVLDNMWRNKQITTEFYKDVVRAKTERQEIIKDYKVSDDKTWAGNVELFDRMTKSRTAEEVKEMQSRIADDYAKGRIDTKDVIEYGVLLEEATSRIKQGESNFWDVMKTSMKVLEPVQAYGDRAANKYWAEVVGLVPQTPTAKIPEMADEIRQKAIKENSPYSNWKVGEPVPANKYGISGKLVGFDKRGMPLIEVEE